MIQRPQPEAALPARPSWLRGLAFACVLLVTLVSTIQAVHIHGQWLPHSNAELAAPLDGSQLAGGEDRCPLCVAMHGALPVSSAVQTGRLIVLELQHVSAASRVPEPHWHFARFSRPPPAILA